MPNINFRAVTFNTLHPVHGVNWGELPMLEDGYDEVTRTTDLYNLIVRIVESRRPDEILAVGLQEVSQSLLDMIRENGTISCMAQQTSRVPTYKSSKKPGDAEYVALIVAGVALATDVKSGVFANDIGKAWVSCVVPELGGLRIGTLHASYGRDNRTSQLQSLESRFYNHSFWMGDFNCPASELPDVIHLKHVYSADTATRIGKCAVKGVVAQETIDHFWSKTTFGGGVQCNAIRVYETDCRLLSDHRPVEGDFHVLA
jgi:endonuclease/exonuclease/phosphatase family metal-dependent hydrolase